MKTQNTHPKMNIPNQYLPIMPYLIVKDGIAFVNFMKTVLGATEQLIVPRNEYSIQHGELKIADAVVMFADATEQWKEKPAGMFIYVENVDDIFHKALENKANILMEPALQEYGRSAGFEDPFGNHWWITEVE
jgi:uncharacterized glyoxalase superfamily protein PhnB